MNAGAIAAAVIIWLIIIGGLSWCFSRWKRTKWED